MYACLSENTVQQGDYTLTAIRPDDIFLIKEWRNAQIDILRQQQVLTDDDQRRYFETVIFPTFGAAQPAQILFSFLYQDKCIGYGGLVHISWADRNAEISFLLETQRNNDIALFQREWAIYLDMLQQIAFGQLGFEKIYTYAYDIRPHLVETLEQKGFVQEARLKRHVFIQGKATDVLIHGVFNTSTNPHSMASSEKIRLRKADASDLMLIFEWANDPLVRKMSFNSNPISLTEHAEWFSKTIDDPDQHVLIAETTLDNGNEHYMPCGQLRFNAQGEIGILVAPTFRGQRLAAKLLKKGIYYIKQQKISYRTITAYIKFENQASKKAFEDAGFVADGIGYVKEIICMKYIYCF
ncbi:MAG: GNAT family N-acetyltransferase [Chitinophagales bacterium]|nr:GNAT family N-acetyltransferase [Chitinophagales bacterium]